MEQICRLYSGFNEVMKIRDIITEENGSMQQDVIDAIPDLVVFPKLINTDPYHQYRFGLAMATAMAVEKGEVEYNKESLFGEQLTVVSRSEEENDIIRLARKLYGDDADYKHLSSGQSKEANDTEIKSTIPSKVFNRYGV